MLQALRVDFSASLFTIVERSHRHNINLWVWKKKKNQERISKKSGKCIFVVTQREDSERENKKTVPVEFPIWIKLRTPEFKVLANVLLWFNVQYSFENISKILNSYSVVKVISFWVQVHCKQKNPASQVRPDELGLNRRPLDHVQNISCMGRWS